MTRIRSTETRPFLLVRDEPQPPPLPDWAQQHLEERKSLLRRKLKTTQRLPVMRYHRSRAFMGDLAEGLLWVCTLSLALVLWRYAHH